jgi:hypothetical protein
VTANSATLSRATLQACGSPAWFARWAVTAQYLTNALSWQRWPAPFGAGHRRIAAPVAGRAVRRDAPLAAATPRLQPAASPCARRPDNEQHRRSAMSHSPAKIQTLLRPEEVGGDIHTRCRGAARACAPLPSCRMAGSPAAGGRAPDVGISLAGSWVAVGTVVWSPGCSQVHLFLRRLTCPQVSLACAVSCLHQPVDGLGQVPRWCRSRSAPAMRLRLRGGYSPVVLHPSALYAVCSLRPATWLRPLPAEGDDGVVLSSGRGSHRHDGGGQGWRSDPHFSHTSVVPHIEST